MRLRNRFREFVPVVLLFVIVNSFAFSAGNMMRRWNMDQDVLIAGNLLLFAVTFFSFLLAEGGLQKKNPHAFVRAIYSSTMIKLLLCIVAAFVYMAVNKGNLNKAALFTCMGLYLVYTFLEVFILMKLLKQKKNG